MTSYFLRYHDYANVSIEKTTALEYVQLEFTHKKNTMASECEETPKRPTSMTELAPVPPLRIRLNASDDDDSDDGDTSDTESTLSLTAATEAAVVHGQIDSSGVSETEEDGSCTTLYSENTDSCSPTQAISGHPSEAELAYAPVWYTSHLQNAGPFPLTSQQQTFYCSEPQSAFPANESVPYMVGTEMDAASQQGVFYAADDSGPTGGYELTQNPLQYIQQGYTTDDEGNTYTIQYVTTVDPAYSQQTTLEPQEVEEQTTTELAPTQSWSDMCESVEGSPVMASEQQHTGDQGQASYPVLLRNIQIPSQWRYPQLVCEGEEGYRDLRDQAHDQLNNFPVLYVSAAGILTVLMRFGVSVELTLDNAIRVLTDTPRMATAISSHSSEACMVLQGVRVYQEGTTTEASLFRQRKALFTTDNTYFASGQVCYRMEGQDLFVTSPEVFSDLSKDLSLNILYSSKSYGPALIPKYGEVVEQAHYVHHSNGGVTVDVNGTEIYQSPRGDVEVTNGVKYIRVSARSYSIYLETNWVEMALEQRSVVKIKRGGHQLYASRKDFNVSANGIEAGLDRTHYVYIQPQKLYCEMINPNRHLGDPSLPRIRRRPKPKARPNTHHERSQQTTDSQDSVQSPKENGEESANSAISESNRVRLAEFEVGETRL